MTIDINKKYKTRDGRDVRILATDADSRSGQFPVIGLLSSKRPGEVSEVRRWTASGAYFADGSDPCDLIEVKPSRFRLLWIGSDNGPYTGSTKFSCLESARRATSFCTAPRATIGGIIEATGEGKVILHDF